jgi:hypothetical protein
MSLASFLRDTKKKRRDRVKSGSRTVAMALQRRATRLSIQIPVKNYDYLNRERLLKVVSEINTIVKHKQSLRITGFLYFVHCPDF